VFAIRVFSWQTIVNTRGSRATTADGEDVVYKTIDRTQVVRRRVRVAAQVHL
jgi:hypothetical protein